MVTENDIAEYHVGFKNALAERDLERAAGYLHLLYMSIGFHPSIIMQVTFEPLYQREFARMLDIYLRAFPDDPAGYLLQMSYNHPKARLDIIRDIWRNTCEKAVKGFHYQPGVDGSVFDAEAGMLYTSLGAMGLGNKVRDAIGSSVPEEWSTCEETPATTEPTVETLPSEPVGLEGVAVNGRLQGFSVPTRYFFRYGFEPDKLNKSTPARYMPAGVYGVVRDGGTNLYRRIVCYAAAVQFLDAGDANEGQDPLSAAVMRLEWPFGKDRNHLDGIGVIDLLLGWENPAQARGEVDGAETPVPPFPSPVIPGEEVDMRDARVYLTYRSADLNPKEFEPVIWLHGRTGTAAFPDEWDDLAAWAVTADVPTNNLTADGNWHRKEFRLPGQATAWTFCGSNMEEMGAGMARYTYAPIQDVLRDNKGGNICIAFVNGQDRDTPEGAIDIAELEMRYRSGSLLGPGQGAKLTGDNRSGGNPERLTNGVIGDLAHCHVVDLAGADTGELTWQLRGEAGITGFKLHQCAMAPAKDVEIALSADGETFATVWSGALVDVPEDPAAWGAIALEPGLLRTVVLPQAVEATFVRLRILSGYRTDIAGLDAFEVFGEGLPFVPSGGTLSLSEKIDDLEAGRTVYAQLVAENEQGTFEGEIIEVARPETDAPVILSAGIGESHDGAVVFSARTLAMGSPSRLFVTLKAPDGSTIDGPEVYIGKWQVPRDVRSRLTGLEPGVSYECTCWAENENGRSAPYAFTYSG